MIFLFAYHINHCCFVRSSMYHISLLLLLLLYPFVGNGFGLDHLFIALIFMQVLMHHGCQWRPDEDPLPLLEMYTVAIMCCAEASPFLSPECENVTDVLEKLSW